jgi:hypothetical protein
MIALALVAALAAQDPAARGALGQAKLIPGGGYVPWAVTPTPEDLANVKPNDPNRGVAGFSCKISRGGSLSHCVEIGEEPAGAGFGGAAARLLPKFKLRPEDARPARLENKRVEVWIGFGGSQGCFLPYCTSVMPPPTH